MRASPDQTILDLAQAEVAVDAGEPRRHQHSMFIARFTTHLLIYSIVPGGARLILERDVSREHSQQLAEGRHADALRMQQHWVYRRWLCGAGLVFLYGAWLFPKSL